MKNKWKNFFLFDNIFTGGKMSVNLKKTNLFKTISLTVVFLFSFQLFAYSYPAQSPNPFKDEFDKGNELYKLEKYKNAKRLLEKLIIKLDEVEGLIMFKGETYLLIGAVYEKLKKKAYAVSYFCKAKKILGYEKTSNENIKFKDLKYYKRNCNASVYPKIGKKKHRSFLGTLLGLALLGGLVWYLFINKNSPLKKDDEEEKTDYSDPSNWGAGFDCFKFTITWSGNGTVYCQTGSSCNISVAWKDGHHPTPSASNNWDDTGTFIVSTTGSLKSLTASLTFKLKGCNNGKIKNTVYVDGKKVLERTDTFVNGCAQESIDAAEISKVVLSVSSTGSHTVRHVVDLSMNTEKSEILNIKSKMNND